MKLFEIAGDELLGVIAALDAKLPFPKLIDCEIESNGVYLFVVDAYKSNGELIPHFVQSFVYIIL